MTKAKRAAAFIGLTLAFALPAGAAAAETSQNCATYPATCPTNGVTEVKAEVQTSSGTSSSSTSSTATLPITGGDVLGLALLGGGAIAAGAVLVRRSRRA